MAKEIPLDRLLIETDCPYLTPHPFRGKRNEPSYVKYIAEAIAELKGLSFGEVAQKRPTMRSDYSASFDRESCR